MTKRDATVLLAACVALGVPSSLAQALPAYDPLGPPNAYLIREPPPLTLSGLWALGRKCAVRNGRLRITATTLAFADEPPVRYDYIPEAPHHLMSYLAPKSSHHEYTYDMESRILIPDTEGLDPNRIYYPCFGPNPGWPPRSLENPDATFKRLVARLIHAPLSDAGFEALSRVYFIKGEGAFRQLARLLNAGRRFEVRARLQRFEQEIAVYPGLEHAGAAGLAPPLPTPDFGSDHAGR